MYACMYVFMVACKFSPQPMPRCNCETNPPLPQSLVSFEIFGQSQQDLSSPFVYQLQVSPKERPTFHSIVAILGEMRHPHVTNVSKSLSCTDARFGKFFIFIIFFSEHFFFFNKEGFSLEKMCTLHLPSQTSNCVRCLPVISGRILFGCCTCFVYKKV